MAMLSQVTNALRAVSEGQRELYELFLEELINSTDPEQFASLFRALSANASLIATHHHTMAELLSLVFDFDWTGYPDDVCTAFEDFIVSLVSANGGFVQPVLQLLVKNLLEDDHDDVDGPETSEELVKEGEEGADPPQGRPVKTDSATTKLFFVHQGIDHVIRVAPLGLGVIVTLIGSEFPPRSAPTSAQLHYVREICRLADRFPAVRDQVLGLVLQRIITLDVHLERGVDPPLTEGDDVSRLVLMLAMLLDSVARGSKNAAEARRLERLLLRSFDQQILKAGTMLSAAQFALFYFCGLQAESTPLPARRAMTAQHTVKLLLGRATAAASPQFDESTRIAACVYLGSFVARFAPLPWDLTLLVMRKLLSQLVSMTTSRGIPQRTLPRARAMLGALTRILHLKGRAIGTATLLQLGKWSTLQSLPLEPATESLLESLHLVALPADRAEHVSPDCDAPGLILGPEQSEAFEHVPIEIAPRVRACFIGSPLSVEDPTAALAMERRAPSPALAATKRSGASGVVPEGAYGAAKSMSDQRTTDNAPPAAPPAERGDDPDRPARRDDENEGPPRSPLEGRAGSSNDAETDKTTCSKHESAGQHKSDNALEFGSANPSHSDHDRDNPSHGGNDSDSDSDNDSDNHDHNDNDSDGDSHSDSHSDSDNDSDSNSDSGSDGDSDSDSDSGRGRGRNKGSSSDGGSEPASERHRKDEVDLAELEDILRARTDGSPVPYEHGDGERLPSPIQIAKPSSHLFGDRALWRPREASTAEDGKASLPPAKRPRFLSTHTLMDDVSNTSIFGWAATSKLLSEGISSRNSPSGDAYTLRTLPPTSTHTHGVGELTGNARAEGVAGTPPKATDEADDDDEDEDEEEEFSLGLRRRSSTTPVTGARFTSSSRRSLSRSSGSALRQFREWHKSSSSLSPDGEDGQESENGEEGEEHA